MSLIDDAMLERKTVGNLQPGMMIGTLDKTPIRDKVLSGSINPCPKHITQPEKTSRTIASDNWRTNRQEERNQRPNQAYESYIDCLSDSHALCSRSLAGMVIPMNRVNQHRSEDCIPEQLKILIR